MFNSTMKRELFLTKIQRLRLKFILLCHILTIIDIINLPNAWNTINYFWPVKCIVVEFEFMCYIQFFHGNKF